MNSRHVGHSLLGLVGIVLAMPACGGQMSIRFGEASRAYVPSMPQRTCAGQRIQVGRAHVSYSTSRSFTFVYGDLPTTAKSGLVFYRGGRRITVTEALQLIGDKKLKDLYFIRLNRPRGQASDERLAGMYWLVSAGLTTLLTAPIGVAGFFVHDTLLRNALIGTGVATFALLVLPQYIIGGLLVKDGNNDRAMGRVMEQVLLSPDLEDRAQRAVQAYNARVCGDGGNLRAVTPPVLAPAPVQAPPPVQAP